MLKRLMYTLGAFFCLTAIGFSVFAKVDPVEFRRVAFQPVREIRMLHTELDLFRQWQKIERITVPDPQAVTLAPGRKSGVSLVADFWPSPSPDPSPALLIFHGSAPWGRKAGLVQLLGLRLNEKGWTILAPDARCFGSSACPLNLEDRDAWNLEADVQQSLDYLLQLPRVDPRQVYILGHSWGANSVLAGAVSDSRVRGIILIGPSRYELEEQSELQKRWWRTRFAADRNLSEPVPASIMDYILNRYHLTEFVPHLMSADRENKILLIDGEKEEKWNQDFLKSFHAQVKPVAKYSTLSDSGHYCGVWNFFGSDDILYRHDIFEDILKEIIEFTTCTEGNA